ncbi:MULTISPECIES: AAA family ATPase [unclassified Streptomyces]|uniref:chloramphenicol phosphotransferase CPT family protein n=1 Tax=unclassified Streptomyces TaxID=2593676 RepID=UPI000DBAAD95|nr:MULTISPECIES: AAA family ATPase [unclassified Streptomyces]MYT72265.1 AAA family ATPase [Streptomyces sp. SID8367]RAJ81678.1 chloramphenicol 3-O phosphotransferase [Streptomyces sp. PsTaAH-137]
MTHVIVLNGGSSSGKTSIARALQEVLPGIWLTLGTDTFVAALPSADAGIEFGADGTVTVGPEFRTAEAAWITGVAAMAAAGARIVVDEVFLGGPASRSRWHRALAAHALNVLWVGVHCAPEVAARREATRGDRITGMAAKQAELVHAGVAYDVVVDTGTRSAEACAREIAGHVRP